MIEHIGQLTPDPRNARKHTPRNVGMIEAALGEVGAARSIVIDEDGVILAGNATIEAAAQAGIERVQVVESDGETIIAVRRRGLTPEQKTKLALYDNRASDLSEWDAGVLAALAEETDLSQLFRDDELAELLSSVSVEPGAGGDEEEEPDFDAPTEVQPGDVWSVGPHIVACLDSTDRANVERLARGVTFVVADPPYGIDIVSTSAENGARGHAFGDMPAPKRLGSIGGAKAFGKVGRISQGMKAKPIIEQGVYAPVMGDDSTDTAIDAVLLSLDMFPRATQFWWGANNYAEALPPSTCWIVWDKENGDSFFADAELAWSNHKSAVRIFKHMWNGLMKASERGERRTHPTQKPQALFQWLYEKYGKVGDVIFDPFLGSGPSIKAAHRMQRTVIGFELSPHYCDHLLLWGRASGLPCTRVESE